MTKEESMFGMRVLRKFKGPASHLISLQDQQNRHFVAIAFYDRYRNHPAITDSLEGLMEFLECPVAKGITPLHAHDSKKAGFIYETGKSKSVAEMIRQASDLGLKPGPRAGLQLIVEVAQILRGAVRIAEEYAICSHGGLTPWRIMVRPDGKLQVIGFAIPQVEVLDFSQNPNNVPSEDSFRYVPPERMSQYSPEDISSDLFALALIGFEAMTTRPVYDGSASIIQESASRADVSLKLNQALMDGFLDRNTHDFLDRALRLHSEDRFQSVDEMIKEGKRLLGFSQLQGMSLFEMVGKTDIQIVRKSQELQVVEEATSMFSRSALQDEDEKQDKIASLTDKIRQTAPKEEIEKEIIPEAAQISTPPPGSPTDLLRLLRESHSNISMSSPVNERSMKALQRENAAEKEAPPQKINPNASLMSALRASISSSAQELAAVQDKKGKTKDPFSMISKPNRSAPVNPPETVVRKEAPRVSNSLKDSLLKSLISKRSTLQAIVEEPMNVETVPEIVAKIPEVVQKEASQEPVKEVVAKAVKKAPVKKTPVEMPSTITKVETADPPEDRVSFEAMDSEDDSSDDAATSIMMRPSINRQKPVQKEAFKMKEAPLNKVKKPAVKSIEAKEDCIEESSSDDGLPSNSISKEGDSTGSKMGDLYGKPLVQRGTFPSNKGERYAFSLGEGIGKIKQSLHEDTPSANVIHLMLLNRLLPMRTDLTGSITSMYRLSKDGVACSGLATMKEFSTQASITLHSVPNDIQRQTFEVHKADEMIRFSAPVGSAVPIASLLDHLVSWLHLDGKSWECSVGDVILDSANILFDVQDMLAENTICLKQKRASG